MGPLAWLFGRSQLSDRAATLAGDLCLASATFALAAFPSEAACWAALVPFIPAVALLRTCPAALLSKAAGLKWPQPCLTTAPHLPPWTIWRLRPLLRTPERRLGRLEAYHGLRSSPQLAQC